MESPRENFWAELRDLAAEVAFRALWFALITGAFLAALTALVVLVHVVWRNT